MNTILKSLLPPNLLNIKTVRKPQLYGILGSMVLCSIVLILLFVIQMNSYAVTDEEEGIMVSFGDSFEGSGTQGQAAQAGGTAPKIYQPKNQQFLTQKDPSVSLGTSADKTEKERLENLRIEQERQASEKKRRDQEALAINEMVGNVFGSSTSNGSGKGSGSGNKEGFEGNPAGRGVVNGNSWSLNGRNLVGNLITPRYEQNVEGEVTVNIRVDENGVVEGVSIGVPTNISDAAILKAAMEAAKNTRFSGGKGKATGTITYHFRLK